MSSKGKRQQRLKENFLKEYSDFPINKIDNVLILGGRLRSLKLGVVKPTYNRETDEITFNICHQVNKRTKIDINIIKKVDCNDVSFSIYLNDNLYCSAHNREELIVLHIQNKMQEIVLSKRLFTDEEVFNALEKISYANSLAKQNPENKGFLYAVKHDFIKYLFLNHSALIEYRKPTTITGEERLLEIKIGDFIFHVPYDRKNRYDFCWDENTKPEVYVKEKAIDIPADLDLDQLNKDLFHIYLKLSGGKLTYMKSDAVRYWYTREIMKKLYVNENANLIRQGKDGISNYSAQSNAKYKLVDTKTGDILEKEMSFSTYFSVAYHSGLKL